MSPFDLKSIFLAKHAQHVAMVHFPIALIAVGVAFDLLSMRKQNPALQRTAYYTLIVAAIMAIPTAVTGILAWQLQFEGKSPRGNLKLHMILALISSALIWIVGGLQIRKQHDPQAESPAIRLTLEVVAVALTLFTAHVGGFVSGVNGPA